VVFIQDHHKENVDDYCRRCLHHYNGYNFIDNHQKGMIGFCKLFARNVCINIDTNFKDENIA